MWQAVIDEICREWWLAWNGASRWRRVSMVAWLCVEVAVVGGLLVVAPRLI